MTKKKEIKCIKCKHYDGKDCHRNGNIGIIIKYRQEKQVFIKTPEELNKEGDCKNYARA